MDFDTLSDHGTPFLNWIETGPPDRPVLLLIHPVGFDLTYWECQIEALRSDFRIVVFDLPGHGLSDNFMRGWSFDRLASTVAGLIESIGTGPVHLVGISFGGMIAQATVLSRPDLVQSLLLLGTACNFAEPSREAMRKRARLARQDGMAALVQSSLERWFTTQTRAGRPELMDRVTKTLLADDPEVHATIWEMIAKFDVQARLGEIRCPTLILVGDADPSTPPAAAEVLRTGILNAHMAVIPNASHMIQLEAPDQVNAHLLSFLSARKPAAMSS